jgi:hypothetical protein
MINKISDHVTVERLVNRHTLFGDDGESHACHHHRVTILRALRERLTGRDLKIPQDPRNAEDARALKDHRQLPLGLSSRPGGDGFKITSKVLRRDPR